MTHSPRTNRPPGGRLAWILLLALILAGCKPLVKFEQPLRAAFASLPPGANLGQTFTSHYAGLQGVALYLKPYTAPEAAPGTEAKPTGRLHLSLYRSTQDNTPLAAAELALADLTGPGFYRFSFTTQPDSRHRDYYLELELQGSGAVEVGTAAGETYFYGASYQDDRPQDEQLTFRLVYDTPQAGLGLLREALGWLWWLALTAFLFVLPGWALLGLVWPGWGPRPWAEKLALASGVGLALYPLFFLWSDLLGLRPGRLFAGLPPLLALLVLAWKNRAGWRNLGGGWQRLRSIRPSLAGLRLAERLPDLTLLLVLALIFGVRFWGIRNLDTPMWGDAYQHTMITQLLYDHGGLFASWEPYVPYHSLTVHFGFSVVAVLFQWLTGLDASAATLLAGQVLNGLAVLTIYPLAVRAGRRGAEWAQPWVGVAALIFAGLLSPMPAFYVNWGRYAQLAGQAILPVALWLLWDAVERWAPPVTDKKTDEPASRRFPWAALLLAGLVLAGMLLHYYRMPFYYATFVLVWLVVWGLPNWRFQARAWLAALLAMGTVALAGGLLFLPRVFSMLGGALSQAVEGGLASGTPLQYVLLDFQHWTLLETYMPRPLLVLCGLAAAWNLLRRHWLAAAMPLWVAALAGYFAGQLFRLPGAVMMQNFAILIALYIPAAILTGWLLGDLAGLARRYGGVIGSVLAALALVGLGLWGAAGQRGIVRPEEHALVSRPDLRAMSWIQRSTPEEAHFLVEGFRIFSGTSIVGSDAGWWISLLGQRQNTLPPQYALLNETPPYPGYNQELIDLMAGLETYSLASQEGLHLVCGYGITHAYIGQFQGLNGYGASQLFSYAELRESPFFSEIYAQDRVRIFALQPGVCANLPGTPDLGTLNHPAP